MKIVSPMNPVPAPARVQAVIAENPGFTPEAFRAPEPAWMSERLTELERAHAKLLADFTSRGQPAPPPQKSGEAVGKPEKKKRSTKTKPQEASLKKRDSVAKSASSSTSSLESTPESASEPIRGWVYSQAQHKMVSRPTDSQPPTPRSTQKVPSMEVLMEYWISNNVPPPADDSAPVLAVL